MNENKLFVTIKILSAFGLLLSIYLLWQQFFRPAFQPCYINSFINCNAIISGGVAKTFGIPTPLFGFIGYIVIFVAAFLRKKTLMLSMSGFGLIFCLWIGYRELFQLQVICPVCITCQLVMIAIFTMGLLVYKNKKKN